MSDRCSTCGDIGLIPGGRAIGFAPLPCPCGKPSAIKAAHAAGFQEGVLAALRWSWPDTNDAGIADMVLMVAPAPAKDGEGETP